MKKDYAGSDVRLKLTNSHGVCRNSCHTNSRRGNQYRKTNSHETRGTKAVTHRRSNFVAEPIVPFLFVVSDTRGVSIVMVVVTVLTLTSTPRVGSSAEVTPGDGDLTGSISEILYVRPWLKV